MTRRKAREVVSVDDRLRHEQRLIRHRPIEHRGILGPLGHGEKSLAPAELPGGPRLEAFLELPQGRPRTASPVQRENRQRFRHVGAQELAGVRELEAILGEVRAQPQRRQGAQEPKHRARVHAQLPGPAPQSCRFQRRACPAPRAHRNIDHLRAPTGGDERCCRLALARRGHVGSPLGCRGLIRISRGTHMRAGEFVSLS